jgi:hypothetical protein
VLCAGTQAEHAGHSCDHQQRLNTGLTPRLENVQDTAQMGSNVWKHAESGRFQKVSKPCSRPVALPTRQSTASILRHSLECTGHRFAPCPLLSIQCYQVLRVVGEPFAGHQSSTSCGEGAAHAALLGVYVIWLALPILLGLATHPEKAMKRIGKSPRRSKSLTSDVTCIKDCDFASVML